MPQVFDTSVSELEQIAEYQPVIDRAIHKLVEARTFQRIDNKDYPLANLLSEYRAEISRPSGKIRIPLVWTIGVELESRIRRQESVTTEDEKLDENDLFDLHRLLVSHNLFLNCFKQSALLLKDIEASAAIYQRIGVAARHLPRGILLRVSENEALVERETAGMISRSISGTGTPDAAETKGDVALRLGLLRGLLHAAGGHLLGGIEKVLAKATVDVAAKALVDMLRADSSFAPVIAFLHQEASALLSLGEQVPIYFGYIRNLVWMLGIHA